MHHCCAAMMEPTGQIYSNSTGCFIAPSSMGNNYLLIIYDHDSYSILAKPIMTALASLPNPSKTGVPNLS